MDLIPLSPSSAASLLGVALRKAHGSAALDCPRCGETAYLTPTSVVCENLCCSFRRGSPIDFMAAAVEGYHPALKIVSEEHPGMVWDREEMAQRLVLKRGLLEFLEQIHRREMDGVAERVLIRSDFQRLAGLDERISSSSQLYLTSKEADTLVLQLSELGLNVPSGLQGRPCSISVFWSNPHEPSGLIIYPRGMKNPRGLTLAASRVNWFGLSDVHPSVKRVTIRPENLSALSHFIPEAAVASSCVLVDPTGPRCHTQFDELHFVSPEGGWSSMLPAWSKIDGFENSSFSYEGELERGSLHSTLSRLLKETPPERFIMMMRTTRLTEAASARILETARGQMERQEWQRLQTVMKRRLLDQIDNSSYYASPGGYEVESGKGSSRISNFTLNVSRLVAFPSSSEIYYVGDVTVAGEARDFSLASKIFDNTNSLASAMRELQVLEGGREELAEIYNHREFKKVMGLLKMRMSGVPRTRGLNAVGWDWKRESFALPGAVVSAAGVDREVEFFPKNSDYRSFKTEIFENVLPDEPLDIGSECYEILAASLAHVMRAYHHLTYSPIAIRNNDAGRTAGLQIFSGLGQKSIFRPSSILPANLNLNEGMPCLTGGLNMLQAARVKIAGAFLAEVNGLDLTSASADEINFVSRVLPVMIAKLVEKALKGEAVYSQHRSVNRSHATLREGIGILHSNFWSGWGSAPLAWDAIDRILDSRQREIAKVITLQEGCEKLELPATLWQNLEVDPDDLAIDLGLLGMTVERSEKSITVEQSLFRKALVDFYGDLPLLSSV